VASRNSLSRAVGLLVDPVARPSFRARRWGPFPNCAGAPFPSTEYKSFLLLKLDSPWWKAIGGHSGYRGRPPADDQGQCLRLHQVRAAFIPRGCSHHLGGFPIDVVEMAVAVHVKYALLGARINSVANSTRTLKAESCIQPMFTAAIVTGSHTLPHPRQLVSMLSQKTRRATRSTNSSFRRLSDHQHYGVRADLHHYTGNAPHNAVRPPNKTCPIRSGCFVFSLFPFF